MAGGRHADTDGFFDFCLHQDSFYVYGTEPEDIAAGAVKHMSKAQKQTLAAFLDELLRPKDAILSI